MYGFLIYRNIFQYFVLHSEWISRNVFLRCLNQLSMSNVVQNWWHSQFICKIFLILDSNNKSYCIIDSGDCKMLDASMIIICRNWIYSQLYLTLDMKILLWTENILYDRHNAKDLIGIGDITCRKLITRMIWINSWHFVSDQVRRKWLGVQCCHLSGRVCEK